MAVETKTMQRKPPLLTSQHVPLFPATKACSLLEKFSPQGNAGEEKKQLFEASVAPAGKLAGPFLSLCMKHKERDDDFKKDMKNIAGNLQCGQSDIQQFLENFSLFLGLEDLNARAGLFLSYIINASKEPEIMLSVKNAPGLDYLGYQLNDKKLYVIGDVGDYFGHSAYYCTLAVFGNTGIAAGYEMGDLIFSKELSRLCIHGNAGPDAGLDMNTGIITVDGDAIGIGKGSGKLSEIHVGGNIYPGYVNFLKYDIQKGKFVSSSYGLCNLFQRGRQIVKEGEIIAQPENK